MIKTSSKTSQTLRLQDSSVGYLVVVVGACGPVVFFCSFSRLKNTEEGLGSEGVVDGLLTAASSQKQINGPGLDHK